MDDRIKLNDSVELANKLRSYKNNCLKSISIIGKRLKDLSVDNPEALENFFDITLIRNMNGEISRTENGQVKGYLTFLWSPVIDHGLSNRINDYVNQKQIKCHNQR